MKAQLIYDLVHQTAWIDGKQMHQYLKLLTNDFSPSGNQNIDLEALKILMNEDKELSGLLLGLATFGNNKEVRDFLVKEMNWSF